MWLYYKTLNPTPWLRNKRLFSRLVTWTQHRSIDKVCLVAMPSDSVQSTWIPTFGGFNLKSISELMNMIHQLINVMKFFGFLFELYNWHSHLCSSYDTRSHYQRVSFQKTYRTHACGRAEASKRAPNLPRSLVLHFKWVSLD